MSTQPQVSREGARKEVDGSYILMLQLMKLDSVVDICFRIQIDTSSVRDTPRPLIYADILQRRTQMLRHLSIILRNPNRPGISWPQITASETTTNTLMIVFRINSQLGDMREFLKLGAK